jgi:hypothetical protein
MQGNQSLINRFTNSIKIFNMRKSLLLLVAVVFGITAIAQNYSLKPNLKTEKAITAEKVAFEPAKAHSLGQASKSELPTHTYKNTDFVSIINIGTSANAYGYGYGGGQKSLVNTNNDLNMVTNIHRMGGALDPGGYSGDLGYDISLDGGMTWTNMNEIYVAVNNAGGEYYTDAIRYPNHGVYNPVGNTDPNNAYLTYFAPNLDQSNATDSWGGYSYGRAKIGDPNDTIRHLLSSHDEYYQYIPDAFCITNLGDFWCSDYNQDWSTGVIAYQGNAIMNKGTWNDETMDWELEQFLIDFETIDNSRPANHKIEFAPDGMTGYMMGLGDNGEIAISSGLSYFPIVFKTTDGGENWSDPISVAIAGEDGIGGVHNFLSDEEIAELYEAPLPGRDEIPFTTAFDFDLSVDAWGNPHIAVVVGITGADPYSIVTGVSEVTGYIFTCAFDITSMDGGENWIGYELGRLKTFRGTFGTDYTEDNRIQISRNHEGTKMFVSWLDTDLPGVIDNQQPDIWCRGIDPVAHLLTNNGGEDLPHNVTEFSEGMWQAYFHAMGNEVLVNGDIYTIPFVYEEMNPEDPGIEVQFKYIQDFAFAEGDFTITGVEDNYATIASFEVGQNFPNPANGTTTVVVTLDETTTLSFELFNMMGQKVFEVAAQSYSTGVQPFTFNASELSSGVYFYTVTAGKTQVTRKMIVE